MSITILFLVNCSYLCCCLIWPWRSWGRAKAAISLTFGNSDDTGHRRWQQAWQQPQKSWEWMLNSICPHVMPGTKVNNRDEISSEIAGICSEKIDVRPLAAGWKAHRRSSTNREESEAVTALLLHKMSPVVIACVLCHHYYRKWEILLLLLDLMIFRAKLNSSKGKINLRENE